MVTLQHGFPLPLGALPEGFACSSREASETSSTEAFETGIDERDVFLGVPRCIVCGRRRGLERCHIIPATEQETVCVHRPPKAALTSPRQWKDIRTKHNWVPRHAKQHATHDPRNGILLCSNHHWDFTDLRFYIRYLPSASPFLSLTSSH